MIRHLKTLWKPKVYQPKPKKQKDGQHFREEMKKLVFGINDEGVEYY